jgi:pectinesterase
MLLEICRKLLSLTFLALIQPAFAGVGINGMKYDFIVSKDSSGDFSTLQAAFNALPDSSKTNINIFVKNGIYKEKLVLPASKTNITLTGEDNLQTIITYDDFSGRIVGKDTLTTHNSCSFRILADQFTACNLTFENSAGRVGQAVAVEVNSDRVIFRHCRFIGNQDTYYTNSVGRIYMDKCYIEGTTDFIFGKSIVLFDSCLIRSKKDSYITAASTPEGYKYGYVFRNCTLMADSGIQHVYLGRPWRDYARVAFINCYLGEQIVPEGWHNWNKPWREKTAFYAEYHCFGPGSDRKQRVNWSFVLSDTQTATYIPEKIFAGDTGNPQLKDEWLPGIGIISKW